MHTEQRRRYFRIGHTSVSIHSKNAELLGLVGDWLQTFETDSGNRGSKHVRFTLIGHERNERDPFVLPADAGLLYENEYTKYYEYRGLWIILLQSATVIVNRSNLKVLAHAYTDDLKVLKYLEDFMHPLLELLRQNGVYAHHAGAVSLNGNGLLILGKSGQGKTTLSVDLLSRGFDFLADDRCFLIDTGSEMEVMGYYEPIRYYPTNVSHIGAIGESESEQGLPKLRNNKSQVDLFPSYGDRIIDKTRLAGLVFPQFSPDEAVSRAEPMPQGEALLTLLPLTMVCFDRSTSKHHFDFCVRVTSTLPAIRLIMGRDRERWSTLIKSYLEDIQTGSNQILERSSGSPL